MQRKKLLVKLLFLSLMNFSIVYADTNQNDIFSFRRVATVLPSPDGKETAYVTYQVRPQLNSSEKEWTYSLFLRNENKKETFLFSGKNISSLQWSHDGKQLSFLAKGSKYQSIWTMDLEKIKPNKLFEFSNDIAAFKWAPDEQSLVFVSNDQKNKPLTTKLIDVNNEYSNMRLYSLAVAGREKLLAEPFTSPNYSISQFFVYPGFDWSPDSTKLVFAYQPRMGDAYSLKNKLAILELKTHALKDIPYTQSHNSTQPAYSPDGKWIAFQANPEKIQHDKKSLLTRLQVTTICVADAISLTTHCLANTENAAPVILGWNKNSDSVFVLDAYQSVGYEIYRLSLDATITPKNISSVSGFIEPLTLSVNNNHDKIGFAYETENEAPQAYMSDLENFKLEQVSRLPSNSKKGNVETIHWQSKDGLSIEGLLITPNNFDSHKHYPLYVSVHGGPSGAWAKRYLGGCDEYGEMVEPTSCWGNMLDMGFIVFAPNPRGSTGYGSEFRMKNFADFGGGDYQDVMTGIDALIKRNIIATDHIAIAGWSYGGYLSAWATTQSNRFKTAITGDGNMDFISFAGTTDALLFAPAYFGAAFWNNPDLYVQRSPVLQAKNIHTPILILNGKDDVRVPVSQAYELYQALNRQHKPVKMLVLPEQGHVPTNPNLIVQVIDEEKNWLKQALN